MKIFKLTVTAAAVCIAAVLIMLCGCSDEPYKADNLTTTNGADGWVCKFDSLNGEYTNTFPINGSRIKITSEISGGQMNIVLKANGVSKSIDGKNSDTSISVEEFGDGSLYITFDAADAKNGSVRIIWEE